MKTPPISSMFAAWFVPLVLLLPAGCETSKPASPAKAVFNPTRGLDLDRQKHAAVLFQADNTATPQILVVGGIDGPAGSTNFANVYNPANNVSPWTASIHRAAYTSFGVDELARRDQRLTAMFDGRILVTGGSTCAAMTANFATTCDPRTPDCMACDGERKWRSSVLLFDPNKPEHDRWVELAWTTKARTRHTATVLPMDTAMAKAANPCAEQGEIVYLIGGMGDSLQATAERLEYVPCPEDPIFKAAIRPLEAVDLTTNSVYLEKPRGSDWSGHTATLLPAEKPSYENATILVVGRITDQKKCEAYLVHPSRTPDAQWEGPLPTPVDAPLPCDGHNAEIIGAQGHEVIAIVGGEVEKDTPLAQVLLFHPRNVGTKEPLWRVTKPEIPRSFAATAVTRSGALIIAGGFEKRENQVDIGRKNVEKYDPTSGQWKSLTPMQHRRVFHTMTNLGIKTADHFLLVGGSGSLDNDPGRSVEILYLNEACETHADCSPGNVCNSGLCKTK